MRNRAKHAGHPSPWSLRWRPLAVLLIAALAAACGNVTAGGATGQAEVYMSGDADESAPAAAPGSLDVGAPSRPTHLPQGVIVGAGLEGEVQVTATLYLRTTAGSLVELTPAGPVTETVDLAGVDEPRVASEVVPEDTYAGVRIVFSDVVANVTAGLEIGGLPFTGAVTVDLGGETLVVDRDVTLTIGPDQPGAVLVDLNAAAWLDLLDPIGGTVDGADFESALEVTTR